MTKNMPSDGLIAITYRCNAKCGMWNIWKYPTNPPEEVQPRDLESLPELRFCNITGGEPFLRDDIGEFVEVMRKKAKRIVISTNGYFTEKVVKLAEKYPFIGVRVSLEGLPAANDKLRGIPDGFDHGLRTILQLRRMGRKDIGFGITVSDVNIMDMMELYELAKAMRLEFATACVHNTFYFHKNDNTVTERGRFEQEFEKLVDDLLKSPRAKDWFRAYFNYGLLNYARGGKRLLPCRAGMDVFFVDPFGDLLACNGMDAKHSMGSLKAASFDTIWNSPHAEEVRNAVRSCPKSCWMMGTVSPAMKREIIKPALWVLQHKFLRKPL